MEPQQFKYKIGDNTFVQRPLVNGQVRQLVNAMEGMVLPGDFNPQKIMAAFGDKLHTAIAIALLDAKEIESKTNIEVGRYLRSRDIPELAADLEWCIEPEISVKVIEDFFDCNPIASLLEKMAALGTKFNRMKTPLKPLSPSSAEETSPCETTSSGDTPPETASRT